MIAPSAGRDANRAASVARLAGGPECPPPGSWKLALREAVRDPFELCRLLELPAELAEEARRSAGDFPLFVTRSFLGRMQPGDPDDPLLRQVLPRGEEAIPLQGFVADPVDDAGAEIAPGLLHKYASRALLVTTGACAVHCRYCFRRHYAYSDVPRSLDDWQPALAAIAADPTIDEVILSGGDPLTIVDETLAELAERLAEIESLKRLRIHTRLPIVLPARVDAALLSWLTGARLTPWMVIHANHAAELDDEVAAALGRLAQAGVPLLNQAVLLRGVNDSLEALEALCRRLIDLRVAPYYLHQLDRVAGAAHFEVAQPRGQELIEQLRARLPGYGVPRFVRETPGAASKSPLA